MKKKVNIILKLITILFMFIGIIACKKESEDESRITFSYQQGTETDYESYMYYTDDYFKGNSTEYNPSLATASLCLAMSSFASNKNKSYDDYSNRYRNVNALMEKLGLHDIEVNDWYTKKPTTDSLGLIFGNKQIFDKTLIVVGIRGANYESEWASNCTMGTDYNQHKGFYDSSTIYLNDLKDYIKNNNITGDIIIWSAGYSRASAVNNIACARIDKAIYENNNILGDVNIKKEDLYCYCFEVPMGASFNEDINPRSEIYNNIFNIVNPNDIVTLVTPSYLGFTRYGIDHYLPVSNLDINYNNNLTSILSFYNKMDNYDVLGEYKISSFKKYSASNTGMGLLEEDDNVNNWTLALYLREFVDDLSKYGIKDIDNYTKNIENGLRNTFLAIYGGTTPKCSIETVLITLVRSLILEGDIDLLLSDLIHNPNDFTTDTMPHVIEAFRYLNEDINSIELANGMKGLLDALAYTFLNNIELLYSLIRIDNIKAIASAHYPELCLAHMMAQDPNYTENPIQYDSTGSYYYLTIPYSESLSLSLDDNILLNNGKIEKTSSYAYGIIKNNFVLYIPTNKEYKVSISGTDELVKVSKFVQNQKNLVELEVNKNNNYYSF